MTRRQKLLSGLDITQLCGLEIGPLASPVVSKEESRVYYVDHADRETLQAKYSHDPNVDVEKISPVDAVWGERTLRECFPDGIRFDYVLASHVIEHVPDMLGWMREVADVLRPGGRLILAVPDKRFTFDYLRAPTRLSEIIDAYLRRDRRPTPAQIFDYNANAVHLDLIAAWQDRIDTASLQHYVDLRSALHRSLESFRDGSYVDGHCSVFTAPSFLALLADLVELDLLPFSCVHMYEPERNADEFIVVLERWADESMAQKENARTSFMLHVNRLDEAEKNKPEETVALRERVRVLESELATLLSSKSFRITRPLRTFASLLRQLRARL